MFTKIKNGILVDPAAGRNGRFELLIEDGVVKEVAEKIDSPAGLEIDAQGCYIFPGFIDLHTHFREPGQTDKETIQTGAAAAAKGGFTTVCTMPNTWPVIDSAELVRRQMEIIEKTACIHVLPVGAVTKGEEGKELAEIEEMVKAGAVAISEDGKSVMDAGLYRDAMKLAAKLGIPVLAHCEDRGLVGKGALNAGSKAEELGVPGITNAVEDVIAARDILLAAETGAQLHLCHCSTEGSVRMVAQAKADGIRVSAEVCPHHFTLTEEDIKTDDANYKMNPPLRTEKDREALRRGLAEGIMDTIATDHAPHTKEEKERPIAKAPFGIVGLETAFALSYTELVEKEGMSLPDLVRRMSVSPAAVLGIKKGSLAEGMAADLVLADMEEFTVDAEQFASKGRNTPFQGRRLKGRIRMTMVEGKIVYRVN